MVRREIARINKNRARAMESRVARYLGGKRTPMSGSGAIKGDCIIPVAGFRNIYVECKLTANKTYRFIIPHKWFEKIEQEAKLDRSIIFGILVIHWHGLHEDWCFLPVDKLHLLEQATDRDLSEWKAARIYETAELKQKLTFTYLRSYFLNGPIRINVPYGKDLDNHQWVIVNIKLLKEILHGSSGENREEPTDTLDVL